MRLFYTNTDGTIEGPFTALEMVERFLPDNTLVSENPKGKKWFPPTDFDFDTIAKTDSEIDESYEEKEPEDPALNNLDECIKQAQQGVAEAQYKLALRYFEGNGVEKNVDEAIKLLKKASDQGLAKAQNELGCSYYNGEGVEKNLSKAFTIGSFYNLIII